MASGRREIPFRLTAENRTQAAFRSLRRDVNQINTLSRSFAGVFGAAFGVASIAQFGQEIRSLIDDLDRVTKAARELGIETEKLAEIEFAGGILGIEEQRVQRLLRAFQAVEAAAIQGNLQGGFDRNRAAFEQLGISLESLREGTRDQRFLRFVETLGRVADEGDRAAIATDLFGRRLAGDILQAAAAGGPALRALINEASEFGTATDELGRRAEALNDGLARVNQASLGRVLQSLENILPVAEDITSTFRDLARFIRDFDLVDFITGIPEGVAQAGLNIGDRIRDAFGLEGRRLGQEFAALRDVTGGLQIDPSDFIGDTAGALESINTSYRDQLELQRELAEGEKERAREAERAARAGLDALAQIPTGFRQQAIDETRRLQAAAQTLLDRRLDSADTGRAVTGSAGQLAQAVLNANQQAADPGVQVLEQILRRLEQEKAAAAVESLKETIGRLNNPVFS